MMIFISGFILWKKIQSSKINESLDKLSTIKTDVSLNHPGDEKYRYLVALQLHRWDIARRILIPLAKKGDADAIYWLSYISGGNVFSGLDMADGFAKAAKLGNIYGALQLSPQGSNCSTYLRGICSEKWQKRAEEIYNSKNASNDLSLLEKYYFKVGLSAREITLDSDITEIIYENANVGNYKPLVDYLQYILYNYDLNPSQKKLVKEILYIPIRKNYVPALSFAYYSNSYLNFDKKDLISRFRTSGGYCISCVNYYLDVKKTRSSIMDAGALYFVRNTLKETKSIYKVFKKGDLITGLDVGSLDDELNKLGQPPLDEKEREDIKEKALKILNDKNIQVYINKGSYNL